MKFILTSLLLASLCASAQTQGPTVSTSPTQPSPTPNSSFLTPNSPDAPATNRPPVVVAPGRAGARDAQALLRKGRHAEAAEAFLSAARGADLQEAEEYRYNAAYAYYAAQDATNAVQTLRPLLASRKNGARAGELLGLILMDQARAAGAEDPQAKAKALEEAAAAFQRALRDAPQDARRDRNLTRAVAPLPEARESAHIAKVMAEHGQTPADRLMGTLLAEQRALLEESAVLFTNDAPALITKAEALAKRQRQQADLWIPLKQQVLQAVTNEQQQAQAAQQIELARDSMKGAADALQDLLPEAAADTAQAEPLVYAFWKAVAPPDAALDEDILCQSNTLHNLKLRHMESRDAQTEALQLTRLFRERFPAQADTNMPPFTAEDKAKIEEIAAHAEKLQTELVEKKPSETERRALQEQALKDLLEIRELLPKKPNQNQQQNQQQQQQQQNQEQQQQEQQQEQKQEQEQKPEPQEQKPEPPQDVKELLRKALEREKEHEEEKKERMRKIPLAPGERDW